MSLCNDYSVSNDGKDDRKHNSENDKKGDGKGLKITALFDIFVLYLFGKLANEDVLLDFINAILTVDEFPNVVRAIACNPINPKKFNFDKDSCLDVRLTDEKGSPHNIEVQASYQKFFMGSMLYYWSKIFTGQIKESEEYNVLKPVNSIALANFKLLESKCMYHVGRITFGARSSDG